jgi:hypothetical protein
MKSKICLEPTEFVDGDEGTVAEIGIFVDRDGDGELAEQLLVLTPAELGEVYERMKLYYERGIWSERSVER